MDVSRDNSLLSLWQHSSTAAFISQFFLSCFTVSEALESVLELETSSDDGSEIEEDPSFPLPTGDSDDDSHTHSNHGSACAMDQIDVTSSAHSNSAPPLNDDSTMQVDYNSHSGQPLLHDAPSRSAGKLQNMHFQ